MRVVIQRVSKAGVTIKGEVKAAITKGLLLFLGIEDSDSTEDIEWLCKKIINLRIFNDTKGVMNNSIKDVQGEILLVSQFTLHASTKKGNRPSYFRAAKPEVAIPVYQQFICSLEKEYGGTIQTGTFGADMQVELVNEGPVTILIDTKNRE